MIFYEIGVNFNRNIHFRFIILCLIITAKSLKPQQIRRLPHKHGALGK